MKPDMKPIIEIYQQKVNDFYEGVVMEAVHKVYVNVDKDRLVKAITDAKAFYEEGYLDAISALQQQTVTNRNGLNEPLTLDELRQMDGEPVWVQFLHNKIGYWDLIGCHNSEFIRFYRSGFLIIDEYGKNFLAYRQKPEEDDKHEAD